MNRPNIDDLRHEAGRGRRCALAFLAQDQDALQREYDELDGTPEHRRLTIAGAMLAEMQTAYVASSPEAQEAAASAELVSEFTEGLDVFLDGLQDGTKDDGSTDA
jgi:hypothetical protein